MTSIFLNGQQYISMPLSSALIAGCFESRTTDTLYFIKFDAVTQTFSGKLTIATTSAGLSAGTRPYIAATTNSNVAVAWWDPTAGICG